ncbi:DUF2807 domain-containing protein [Lacinutrix neustonica]|uniref:DUF2807 domain-containing protein n=2 Tax=Lacinutrix neustonica TaxID=2980107 RepID=A0A9E8SFK3_9FLAO|nr:DUF2807 domain-containing protein [Lacinutrix neustonica]
MKYRLSTFLLGIAFIGFSQNPMEKRVNNFTTVKVFDLIHISLVKSDENKVIISGQDADDVEVLSKNGTLKVRMKFERSFDGTKTFVAVHYKNIEVIDGNEGSKIFSNELIEQDKIELRAQEGAVLKVGLDVKELIVRAVSGGIIIPKGKAETQDITINTGGVFEGRDFDTKETYVKVTAAGEAEIKASDLADVKITAGGDVYIYGKPKKLNKKQTFGGRIEIRDGL